MHVLGVRRCSRKCPASLNACKDDRPCRETKSHAGMVAPALRMESSILWERLRGTNETS
jgi:hypothetical protein